MRRRSLRPAQLRDIERLALGDALGIGDVEQDDVAQFLQAGQQRQRAADLPGADQRDLLASHERSPACCLEIRPVG